MKNKPPIAKSASAKFLGSTDATRDKVPILRDFKSTADALGCSTQKLHQMINRGEAPVFVLIGTRKMFRDSSINKWLASREREGRKILRRNESIVQKHSPSQTKGTTKMKKRSFDHLANLRSEEGLAETQRDQLVGEIMNAGTSKSANGVRKVSAGDGANKEQRKLTKQVLAAGRKNTRKP